jgi:hypothetical protein
MYVGERVAIRSLGEVGMARLRSGGLVSLLARENDLIVSGSERPTFGGLGTC